MSIPKMSSERHLFQYAGGAFRLESAPKPDMNISMSGEGKKGRNC